MKFLKLLLVVVLLCKTINADNGEEKTVRRNRHGYSTRRQMWRKNVGAHHDGIRSASVKFRGTALDITKPIDVLQAYIATVTDYTSSTSTILASSSTDILASISRCNKLGQSCLNIVSEFSKVLLDVIEDFRDIVEKLSKYNEKLTNAFNKAVSEFGSVFLNYLKDVLKEGSKKQVDFKPTLKKLQNLTTIVCEASNNSAATKEELETVLVLDLIYLYLANAVEGITTCSVEVLHTLAHERRQKYRIQEGIKFYLLSLNKSLTQILQAVKGVVSPLKQSVNEVLIVVSKIIKELNAVFNRILGEGKIKDGSSSN